MKYLNSSFRRDPKSLVEGPKDNSEKEVTDYKNRLKKVTPTASRHLLLIRHGQYVDTAKYDSERVLTSLGKYHDSWVESDTHYFLLEIDKLFF